MCQARVLENELNSRSGELITCPHGRQKGLVKTYYGRDGPGFDITLHYSKFGVKKEENENGYMQEDRVSHLGISPSNL